MKGQTVLLYTNTQTGTNRFGEPVFTETAEPVENVLIGEPSTDDITTSTQLFGKTIQFMLGIPKGDTHNWEDKHISWTDAYGRTIHVKSFGYMITGIESNIPGPWHGKVRVAAYG